LNIKKQDGSILSQQEQIQCIDSKIQEILSSRKKYNSLENLHKRPTAFQQLSCLDETKASSSNSSQTRGGIISYKAVKAIGGELQPPRSSDKNFIKDAKDLTFKPRIIRTTTPYKQTCQEGLDFNKMMENRGKFNFNDINHFKRIEGPIVADEHFIMNGTMKPQTKNENYLIKKQDGIVHLPPLATNGEKLAFTGTFNPHSFEKNNKFLKHAAPKAGNIQNKPEIAAQTGYFMLEDAMQAKNIFQIKSSGRDKSLEFNDEMAGSKQKNASKFPKDVFATNVKRKFFV